MAVDCYTTFDETCGDTTGVYGAPGTAAGSSSTDVQSWINTLGGLASNIAGAVERVSSGQPVAGGRGIPTNRGAFTPVQQTGISALLVVVAAGILVWLASRRRRR